MERNQKSYSAASLFSHMQFVGFLMRRFRPSREKTNSSGVRSGLTQTLQSQKKFRIEEEKILSYLCSENKRRWSAVTLLHNWYASLFWHDMQFVCFCMLLVYC